MPDDGFEVEDEFEEDSARLNEVRVNFSRRTLRVFPLWSSICTRCLQTPTRGRIMELGGRRLFSLWQLRVDS